MTSHERTIKIPTVFGGPKHLTPEESDAMYYREAAASIRWNWRHAKNKGFAGSNLTEAVARLCEAAAESLDPKGEQRAWGTAPDRYVLQENTGGGWENIATYKFFEYAIEDADKHAELHPQHQYRIIDTQEESQ